MKEYSYKDIKEITEIGILFKDDFKLLFEECRNEWCIEHKIKKEDSHCVAERDCLAQIPYFLFYSKNRIKIIFDEKGIFYKKKNKDNFHDLQFILYKFGFSSYDMT